MSWSQKHDKCSKCGTQTVRHVARGLCLGCYSFDNEHRQKLHISRAKFRLDKGVPSSDDLRRQYVEEQMSLTDLARQYNCTRQYILKLLKQYDIKRRTKAVARAVALSQNKLFFDRVDEFGNPSRVFLRKISINKSFFKSWSPEMAYVLGVIYTDGNLRPGNIRDLTDSDTISIGRFTVYQKEPELLEKILKLMNCDATLLAGKQKLYGNNVAGEIYYFHVNDDGIYDDLLHLGLTPNKSLTMQFPHIPSSYARHFIRGCWDGDGSVYLEKNNLAKPCASFVSGSKEFMKSLIDELAILGLPPRKLYENKNGRSYYFRFTGISCERLFHVFYDDVPESLYLLRKYKIFKAIADNYAGYTFDQISLSE